MSELSASGDSVTGFGFNTSLSVAIGDVRWSYEYDANGNMTWATKQVKETGSWNEKLKWKYYWNPRDRMERADKFISGLGMPEVSTHRPVLC